MKLKHSGSAGIVMAAGKGTRFASTIPKVMQLVGGTPILKHVVGTGLNSGLNPLVVVIRPDIEIGLAGEGHFWLTNHLESLEPPTQPRLV